jgi:acyl-coenzyme A synthetase/AMP-(fatty) acid ligase
MRAPATTLEMVEAWALVDPSRPALREDDVELSYGQFANALLQCAVHLRELGVRHGQRVAVSGPGVGIQLAVLLACEALGAVTASFLAEGDPDAAYLFTKVDWVFSGRAQKVPGGVRFELLDASWVDRLAQRFEAPDPDWTPAELDEPQRILRTSGSTGGSKFMVLRRRAQERWLESILDPQGHHRNSRLLMLGPFVINAIYGRCCECLRAGGTLLSGHGSRIAELAPTHTGGLPAQIERLLSEIPPGYVSPHPVRLMTTGGLLPPSLRARCEQVFHGVPANRYGSNETHLVCHTVDAAGLGLLAPGVEVRILDDSGRTLPPGQVGIIAVRTPAMADGYLDRPEETAAAFRDGWFVSGDVGALVGRGQLRLLGRHDGLVNLGGIKVPATQIEEQLRGLAGIADAAVLAAHQQGGAVSLGIAIVAKDGATGEQVMREVEQALSLGVDTPVRILLVSAIPRMHTGKTDRMALLRLFQSA